MVHGLRVLLLGVWCAGCSAYSIATPRVARPRRASPLLMVDPTQIADLVRSGELVEPSYGIDMYHHLTPEKFISDMAWTTFIAIGGVMGENRKTSLVCFSLFLHVFFSSSSLISQRKSRVSLFLLLFSHSSHVVWPFTHHSLHTLPILATPPWFESIQRMAHFSHLSDPVFAISRDVIPPNPMYLTPNFRAGSGAYVTADTVDTDFEPLPPPPRHEEEERE